MDTGYPKMGQFLNNTGRSIIYSCIWPKSQLSQGIHPNYTLIADHCNLWRNFWDVRLNWERIQDIISYYDRNQDELAAVHGPGHWNDPDMIVVGNAELSLAQAEAQMALWSVWSAPLIMSNDLRFLPPAHKRILLNRKVIAVDQDTLGIMGKLVANTTYVAFYLKPMTPVDRNGQHSYAVAILNRNGQSEMSERPPIVVGHVNLILARVYTATSLLIKAEKAAVDSDKYKQLAAELAVLASELLTMARAQAPPLLTQQPRVEINKTKTKAQGSKGTAIGAGGWDAAVCKVVGKRAAIGAGRSDAAIGKAVGKGAVACAVSDTVTDAATSSSSTEDGSKWASSGAPDELG